MNIKPERNTLYSKYEDFRLSFLPSDKKKVLILGMTGAGKSSLLNCLSGIPLEQKIVENDEDDFFESESYEISCPGQIFPIGHDAVSQTQQTCWSWVKWMGNEAGQDIILIDSPGLCDSHEKAKKHMPDWQAKMKKIGALHLILIVLPDITNPRFTKQEHDFLSELNIAFDVGAFDVWNNVAICFSKCNENSKSTWASHAKKIRKQLPLVIKKEFNTDCDVPIFFFSTIRGQMPRSKVNMIENLLNYINTRKPLETEEVKEIKNQHMRRLEAEKREKIKEQELIKTNEQKREA